MFASVTNKLLASSTSGTNPNVISFVTAVELVAVGYTPLSMPLTYKFALTFAPPITMLPVKLSIMFVRVETFISVFDTTSANNSETPPEVGCVITAPVDAVKFPLSVINLSSTTENVSSLLVINLLYPYT